MNENNLPKRKKLRLKNYNYSSEGTYFITICTKNKEKLLSEICLSAPPHCEPVNILTTYGNTVDKYINQLNSFYSHISVDKYVIMPNHIHLLISISISKSGASGTPPPTNSSIAMFISTLKRFCNREYGKNIWQRSSYDHIVRDSADYRYIWNYIDGNISKWQEDTLYVK